MFGLNKTDTLIEIYCLANILPSGAASTHLATTKSGHPSGFNQVTRWRAAVSICKLTEHEVRNQCRAPLCGLGEDRPSPLGLVSGPSGARLLAVATQLGDLGPELVRTLLVTPGNRNRQSEFQLFQLVAPFL